MLGGSAVHFSLASSFFTDVRVVGPVGNDFGVEEYGVLHGRQINTDDIETIDGGKTFFWRGHYEYDLNTAHTDDTQLNVFGDFAPKLSDRSKDAGLLFLANIQPDVQRAVAQQCENAKFVALDSMNLWIDIARDSLIETISLVNAVFMNDAEIRQLTEESNLVKAARKVMSWGPEVVVAKQGEYGAALFTGDDFFALPAFPLEDVLDPTGAGDSFAGGFMGYLASQFDEGVNNGVLRRAMAYGSVMASFNVEQFGTERVRALSSQEIADRFAAFRRITHFEDSPITLR